MRGMILIGLTLLQVTAHAGPTNRAAEKVGRVAARVVQAASRVSGKIAPPGLRRTLGEKLRLNEAILEVQGGVNTGVPGFFAVGASGVFALSGKDTGNKRVIRTISPGTSVQVLLATGSYSYVPGIPRPHAFSGGLGPWKYKIYDPVHRTPLVGVALPLIGSVSLGPKMFGISIDMPIPFLPGFKWCSGAWITHPWLAPVTGTLWKTGGWAWARSAPLRNWLSPYLSPVKLALLGLKEHGATTWARTEPVRHRLRPHVINAGNRGRAALEGTRRLMARARPWR